MVEGCKTIPEPRSMKPQEQVVSLINMGIRVGTNAQKAEELENLVIQIGFLLVLLVGIKAGHKVNSCFSKKVNKATHIERIVIPCETPPKMVKGMVEKIDTQMSLDAGADRSVVNS